MLLKVIGCIIILSASAFAGIVISSSYGRRPRELRELQGLLQMLENEIGYMSNVLFQAFNKLFLNSSKDIGVIFQKASEHMEDGMNADEAWEKAVREKIKNTALNREDEEILVTFGKMLGNSDTEGQLKNIRLTMTQLKLQEDKAEDSRKKNEVMYRSLGILGGLALVIILI